MEITIALTKEALMLNEELQEKIRSIKQCQQVLYALHEEYGTRFAKTCADYLNYTLDSLEKPHEKDVRKEFAVGQKVQLADTVQQKNLISQISPHRTYKKGAIGWICNDGLMYCQGQFLRLNSEKVHVTSFDAEAVTEYLWHQLTRGQIDTSLAEMDWERFSARVEDALWHLNLPVPKINPSQQAEITFDDLDKHQFWQHRQDLFLKE